MLVYNYFQIYSRFVYGTFVKCGGALFSSPPRAYLRDKLALFFGGAHKYNLFAQLCRMHYYGARWKFLFNLRDPEKRKC